MATIESGATIRNGVDTAKLFATLDAVRAQPAAAQFTFRVANRWLSGTHSENRISGFFGVGVEQDRGREFIVETDHPEVLVGNDNGPTPAEMLLGALASCLTSGIGNIAAARKVPLTHVESLVEGDIDLNGILGLDPDVRNGFREIRVRFTVTGDAPAEKLRAVVEQARERSAVYDVITNGAAVSVEVTAS
jgi:uncharacterized OsmC-like protein